MSTVSNVKKSGRPRVDATPLSVRVPPDLLADLDRFIAEECPGTSRPEALRRLAAEALTSMGIKKVDENV